MFTVFEVLAAFGNQSVRAVQGHPAVVPDDAAAAIGVRKAGNNAGGTGRPDIGSVGVENAFIVRLAYLFENIRGFLAHLEPVGFQGLLGHAQAAKGHQGPFQGGVCLEAYDHFQFLVKVAGLVGGVEDTTSSSASRTPPLSISLFSRTFSSSHKRSVRWEGPERNSSLPE